MHFKECGARFQGDATLRDQWGWNGTIIGIQRNPLTQISREGCLQVCGSGTDYYPWKDVSSTITTWLLPVVGTLLQAPFESNATKRTFLAIARWIGSPIASLSYVLWNIKVSAKAALMVDMAVKYNETPDRKTDFGSMRDSMYLLLVMNQYTLKRSQALREKEAEGLLRIVLFSKDLKLTDTNKTLRQMRRILARELREMRRRGAVPVFVSTMWFLFAFCLSVEGAFGSLGQNTTAHDLALGCLLAWFPILIMASIVDRNPIASEAIRKKLNALVDHVRHSLRDKEHRKAFVDSFEDQPNFQQLKAWVDGVAEKGEDMYEFFEEFAGQARVRWHYGAAHPILSDIENCYIAEKGRNWLANEREARSSLVLGTVNDEGLLWFDIREFWQVGSAVLIVLASCGGAFTLSYFTPTVGLGCRSGGYTIFFCIAMGLLIVEMTVWLVLSPYEMDTPWIRRTATRLQSNATLSQWEDHAHGTWVKLKRRASSFLLRTEDRVTQFLVWLVLLLPWKDKRTKRKTLKEELEDRFIRLRRLSAQRKWEVFFFRPMEFFNAMWLVYIVLAQTFGWYKTCACVTSTWAGGGGYLDFSVQDISNSRWVLVYWTTGTVITGLAMMLSMFYITVEWCQQSFLSTEIYNDAMAGLRMTRSYRSYTYFFRVAARFVSKFTFDPLERLGVTLGLIKTRQKTLLWTKHHRWIWQPQAAVTNDCSTYIPPPSPLSQHALGSPSIELTDYSTVPLDEGAIQDTPAMAHSLFPPAIPSRRPRNHSDASNYAPSLPLYEQTSSRASDDTMSPFIQRPSDVHRSRAKSSYHTGSDRHRSSESSDSASVEAIQASHEALHNDQYGSWLGLDRTVHSRQGYRRANSDPGEPPLDIVADLQGNGLGIGLSGAQATVHIEKQH